MFVVFLNRFANHGKAQRKWRSVAPILEKKYLPPDYSLIERIDDLRALLHRKDRNGSRVFIAAGGDGTVNFLVNEIMNMGPGDRTGLILGAIGLGSSNDFHKPLSPDAPVHHGVWVKADPKEAAAQNVGQADLTDISGSHQRRYFLVNAGVGVVAQANYFFNRGDPVIRFLKPKWVSGAIWYSGLKTLVRSRNIPAVITVADRSFSTEVTNVNVIINPHLSGSLRFDVNVSPFSGVFGVGLCYGMKLGAKLRTFLSLARGKFLGLPRTAFWTADAVRIVADRDVPVELDGEVTLASRIEMRILQGALNVCQ